MVRMDEDDDSIESYWEDIRFYPPEPVDPIIKLRAEDRVRKDIAEELGEDAYDYRHVSFESVHGGYGSHTGQQAGCYRDQGITRETSTHERSV